MELLRLAYQRHTNLEKYKRLEKIQMKTCEGCKAEFKYSSICNDCIRNPNITEDLYCKKGNIKWRKAFYEKLGEENG